MNKFLIYTLIFAAGIVATVLFYEGCGDKKKPDTNESQNLDVIDDTLKVIKQEYKGQIATKEAIIMNLEAAVKALKEEAAKGSKNAASIARQIEAKNNEINRLGGEIQSLLLVVSNLKVKDTAPIIEVPNEDPEKPSSYYTIFKDSSEWYNATVVFDISQGQGSLNLLARDSYALVDYIGADNVEYFQIQNFNPHVSYDPFTNLFKKPTPKPTPLKKNLLAGLYGRSTDGRVLYSGLYGRRFLKHGKVFIQGVYSSDKELSGMAGLGLDF